MLNYSFTGANFVAGFPSALGIEQIYAWNPTEDRVVNPAFSVATVEEVDHAVREAAASFQRYSAVGAELRAQFLEEIATKIEALGDELISRASVESGLTIPRLTGERGRTCNQLRMFAKLVREGSWVDARIDTADPARVGGGKPDLRRMLVPLGPVAVFGASNFPLAFSVAGGDTASAFAAGCPVVVKAHPAHPGTSELVAKAIISAIEECGLPSGMFSLLHGGKEVGEHLVMQPGIEAVGFTGSLTGGRALYNLAASRDRPIPVFAEMGSVNPLFVLPAALNERFDALVQGYADSLTLGVGQFCTNPGLLVGIGSPIFDKFLGAVGEKVAQTPAGVMLTKDILGRYQSDIDRLSQDSRLSALGHPGQASGGAKAAIFSTTGKQLLANPDLLHEVFGPAALAVRCESVEELEAVAMASEGQLTATLHFAESDLPIAQTLLPILTRIAGRVIANGYPTGVEVGSAMQHGGPYPATTDSRSTSVGTGAILRFARPVSYQNIPESMLPSELLNANPRNILRLIDGEFTRDGIDVS